MADAGSTPSAKRRKLNAAARVLSRPFKPPSRAEQPSSRLLLKTELDSQLKSVVVGGPAKLSVTTSDQRASTALQQPCELHSATKQHQQPQSTVTQTTAAAPPANVSERSSVRQLEVQIRSTRADLDLLQRALDLQASEQLDRLQNLTNKWRRIAQAAADELYPTAKARAEVFSGATQHPAVDGHTLPSSSQSVHEGGDIELADGGADSRLVGAQDCCSSSPSESSAHCSSNTSTLTMEQMLQSLGIDVDMIGYDALQEQWR